MAFYNQLNSFFTDESEEERRRREEEERLRIERETPVKQTIEIDPVTGAQKVKIEGSAYNLSASNPLTPTISGPVAPDQSYVGTPGFNPNAAPVNLNQPTQSNLITADELERRYQEDLQRRTQQQPTELNQLPQGVSQNANLQPTTPVVPQEPTNQPVMIAGQATSDVGLTPTEQALKQQRVVPEPTTAAAPTTTAPTAEGLSMGPPMAAAGPEAWMSKIDAAKNNIQALSAINADSQTPSWARSIAAEELGNALIKERKAEQARQKAETIVQNQGRGFERALKDTSEEGNHFRAFIYRQFGFNKLADEEEAKLGAGDIYQTATLPGGTAQIKFGANGRAKSGVYTTGEFVGQQLSPEELLQASSSASFGSKFKPEFGTVYEKTLPDGTLLKGVRVSGVSRTGQPVSKIEANGKLYDLDGSWRQESISVAGQKAELTRAVELRYTGPIAYTKAGAEFIGKFNAENGTNLGYASQTPGAPLIDRNTGQQVTQGTGGTIRATTTTGGAKTDTTGKAPVEIAAVNKVKAEQGAKDQKNQFYADSTYGLIQSIDQEIRKSTGSGIGAGVDTLAGLLGKGTSGAQAIAKLEILSGPILNNVPRFEGPQSDKDVAEYRRQAGDFANPNKPVSVRLAALDAMITILKKYDKEGKNDWTFGQGGEVDRNNPLLKKK